MSGILAKIQNHKIAAMILGAVILGGGYYWYNYVNVATAPTRYVLAKVEKGMLIVSVSGTGQISASNQIDIKPKVSGEITIIPVVQGQEVKSGAFIAQLDTRDAQKIVRDAEISVETARLELDRLLYPTDDSILVQSENSLIQAKDSLTKLKFTQENNYQNAVIVKQKAEDALKKSYEDSFNTVSNAFLELPAIISGLNDLLFGYNFNLNQQNIDFYRDTVKNYDIKADTFYNDAYNTYRFARIAYDKNFTDYKAATRYSDTATIESLVSETYDTTKLIAEAVKSANNLIQFYEDTLKKLNLKPVSLADTHLATLNTYTGKTNTHLSNILSTKQTIQNNKDTIVSSDHNIEEMVQNNPLDLAAAERSIVEKEKALAKLKAGPDDFDVRAKKIALQQKEDALIVARQNLADYFIRASFDGIIAKVHNKKGDSVSASAAIAILISKQKIATITLNEVDIAKAKTGQKATLTFDAIDGLSLTGQVVEIDSIGTVAQGVVTYNIKIALDAEDDRIKPGMSVSVAIITDAKQDVLLVPNSAVKQQGDISYAEVAEGDIPIFSGSGSSGVVLTGAPRSQAVVTGLSNDTMIEIISGLNEDDNIVTRTISGISATTAITSSSSGLRIPGLTGIGGRTPISPGAGSVMVH